MVQKVPKARKKIDPCNVCNGPLYPSTDVILGKTLNVFKCPDCGEVEVPIFEAMKLDPPSARARAIRAPSSRTTA